MASLNVNHFWMSVTCKYLTNCSNENYLLVLKKLQSKEQNSPSIPKHRMFLSDFLPWIPFRVHCPGLIAAACSLTLCITEWWATLFPLFCLWKEGSLDGSEEWWHQKAEENIYIMCDVLYKKRNDKKLYNTCIVALKEIQESIASVKYEKQG